MRAFDRKLKRPLFSTVTLAAIFFIIYAAGIISNVSLQSCCSDHVKATEVKDRVLGLIKPMVAGIPLHYAKEETAIARRETLGVEIQQKHLLLPPENATEEQRIKWFGKKLPEFDIFWSTSLSQDFHERVVKFFNKDCEVQFFMTWISRASSFGKREFLALESLFQVDQQGCLIILSGTMDSEHGRRILQPLTDRGFRVEAVTPNLSFLLKHTPAKTWFNEMKSGKKDPGEIPFPQNLSNLLRLAVLYKYGGVYLDMDFIMLKSFKGLKNSIGAQSIDAASKTWTRLNNAVLVFDKQHPLVFKFMKEFALTFNGSKWGHNGPYLVSRVVHRVSTRGDIGNFTVLPPMAFYPVDWSRIGSFFNKPRNEATSRWIKAKLLQLSGDTYGVHLWNKQSSGLRIEEGSIIHRLMSDHCVICQSICNS